MELGMGMGGVVADREITLALTLTNPHHRNTIHQANQTNLTKKNRT
jgi:hypothetical protein